MRNRTYDLALADLKNSLQEAGLDYFDLYLMHSPLGGAAKRKEVWRALLVARDQGLVKSVGVSNFGAKHIDEMIEDGVELPVLNQIDLHPFMRHPDIVDACEKHGIALEVSCGEDRKLTGRLGPPLPEDSGSTTLLSSK